MKKIEIMLDPGHGAGRAHNRGFVQVAGYTNCNEGDQNFIYSSKYLKPALEAYGIKVGMTRNKITDNPSLEARGKMGKGYDILISVHTNASNGRNRGVEIWDSTNPKESIKPLTDKITKAIAATLGTPNRGTKYRKTTKGSNYYGVLRNGLAKHNFIIENVFHDNYTDAKVYLDNMDKLAQATAKEIADFYGIRKENKVTEQKAQETKTYEKDDWKESWAKDNIQRVMELGLMTGYEDGSFRPQNPITRAELATVMVRLIDKAGLDIKK